jgi:WD40 repeat protein/energy-coupling factor transporter ATP-binding protein EcfA2
MAKGNIRVGNVRNVSGEVAIAAGDIYKGYTADQVATLIQQIKSEFQPRKFDGRSPYKGLDVFEEEDADLFFGRGKLIDDLVCRVEESHTVFITGPSGSGKSSLVRAGLIPALKKGVIKNSKHWLYETIKPGRDPLEALTLALSRLKSPELGRYFREHIAEPGILNACAESALGGRRDQRLVLFVDQFEEIFTQVSQEAERAVFLNLLTQAAVVENGRVIILFAMRSDFVSNCAGYPALNALLNRQFVQIGAMQPDELVSAIAQPALRVGLHIDPDLIAQIINDMRGEPGVLPLMQFALKDLFDAEQAKGGVIDLMLDGYLQRGGIHKSLERHADEVFSKLSDNEQNLARSIFIGLVDTGHGTQDARRTALFNEIVPAGAKTEEVRTIVEKLADARLITTDEQAGRDVITISHEKLIDAWPWLKSLVNENREVIALQHQIINDAREWQDHERNASYLYTGARLENAREQLEAKKLVLSDLPRDFVQAARTQQRRRQAVLISGIAAIMVLLLVAVIVFNQKSRANEILAEQNGEIAQTAQAASTLAFSQQSTAQASAAEAQKQAAISRASELAAQSLSQLPDHLDLAQLLAVEAFNSADNVQSRNALLRTLNTEPQLDGSMMVDQMVAIRFTPDGNTLVGVAAQDYPVGQIQSFDLTTLELKDGPILDLSMAVNYPAMAFSPVMTLSPDGSLLAINGKPNQLLNTSSGELVSELADCAQESFTRMIFSPDGDFLICSGSDGYLLLWDIEAYQKEGVLSAAVHTNVQLGDLSVVAIDQENAYIAVGFLESREGVELWSLTDDHLVRSVPTGTSIESLAFSGDGKLLAAGGSDGALFLWSMEELKKTPASSDDRIGFTKKAKGDEFQRNAIQSLSFSPDSQVLATGNETGTVNLWDVDSVMIITGNMIVPSADLPPEILTPMSDLPAWIDTWPGTYQLTFSADGALLATAGCGVVDVPANVCLHNQIKLWRVRPSQPVEKQLADLKIDSLMPPGGFAHMAVTRSGKALIVVEEDQAIFLDAVNGIPTGDVLKGTSDYSELAISADGRILAIGGQGILDVWINEKPFEPGLDMGQLTRNSLVVQNEVSSLAFSPDDKTLAVGAGGDITLWDVVSGERVGGPIFTGYWVQWLAFGGNGRELIYIDPLNLVFLNAKTGKIDTTISVNSLIGGISRDESTIPTVAISPDGKLIALSVFASVILVDAETGLPVGQPLAGQTWFVDSLSFSCDGSMLAAGGNGGSITLWDVATRVLIGSHLYPAYEYGSLASFERGRPVKSVVFDPQGLNLHTSSVTEDGMIIERWDLNPVNWQVLACRRASRNFTQEEWMTYFPHDPYPTRQGELTCPQWQADS